MSDKIKFNEGATPQTIQFFHDLINFVLSEDELAENIPQDVQNTVVGNLQVLCWLLDHGNQVEFNEDLPDPYSIINENGDDANHPEGVVPAHIFHYHMKMLEAMLVDSGIRLQWREDDMEA